jgi:predicted nucleic acid-binding protein
MSPSDEVFLDTNVLLHLMSGDAGKADRAEALVAAGGVISVQVLNEFVSVASRKLGMTLADIREVQAPIRLICTIEPLTLETHDLGVELAERYRLSIYDSFIVAAAVLAGCKILYSEDMQHGQTIGGLTVRNPFTGPGDISAAG